MSKNFIRMPMQDGCAWLKPEDIISVAQVRHSCDRDIKTRVTYAEGTKIAWYQASPKIVTADEMIAIIEAGPDDSIVEDLQKESRRLRAENQEIAEGLQKKCVELDNETAKHEAVQEELKKFRAQQARNGISDVDPLGGELSEVKSGILSFLKRNPGSV